MKIEGPLLFTLLTDVNTQKHSLRVTFKQEFQDLPLVERTRVFSRYVQELTDLSANRSVAEEHAAGLELVLTFSRQLVPHIAQDSIPLGDPITIDIEHKQGLASLIKSLH